MPGSDVVWPLPLTRLNPVYPGQFGILGTANETGLRMHSTGTIFYVDPNFPGVVDQRDGTDPLHPLATVAAALTKCQPYRGDVVVVMANNSWQYGDPLDLYALPVSEEVEMTVPGVRLVGLNQSGMGVYWTPASNGGTCITVSAIDCVIEGFAFTEGAFVGCNAIYCEWDGTLLFGENLTVRHNTFDDTVDIAIQLEFSWYCDIHDNAFWECDEFGIYVDAGGSAISYCLIHDNVFQNCDVAIALLGGCDENQVYRNRVYNANAQGAGAATNEGINTTGGSHNLITENFLSCLLPAGAAGDFDDLNSAAATDAWVQNYCLNGPNVTSPT